MPSCVVIWCINNSISNNKSQGITFHICSTLVVAALLCVVVIASAAPPQDVLSWNRFKTELTQTDGDETHKKTSTDYQQKIAEHNEKFRRGLVSYSLKTSDYSDIDFLQKMNGYNHSAKIFGKKQTRTEFVPTAYSNLPKAMDWRENGAVTEVKNQGQYCGSCWAFSVAGALEGQYFRKTGKLVSLSAQNLVDCSGAYGTNGCDGGLMDDAFEYVRDNGGIDTEEYYPYQDEQSECRYNHEYSDTTLADVVDIPSGDEALLMAAVAQVGPVSVAVDASLMTFQSYSHGVYYDRNCSSMTPNHAMLVVGYGSDARDGDYWLVKNSWGESWGMLGYMKLARNRNNHCGIATVASYPVI